MLRCRFCNTKYSEEKNRPEWEGYCTQQCMKRMARNLGLRQLGTGEEYQFLEARKEIGIIRAPITVELPE